MGDSTTRQRMVEAAVRLFQCQGYQGTSWRTLVRASGTPWGSIQHHFPGGKEELGIAAVEYAGEAMVRFIDACFVGADSPAAAVRAWFTASGELLSASGYEHGCPVAAVALDLGHADTTLRAACAEAFTSWERALERGLRAGGMPPAQASGLGVALLAAFEGALLLARAQHDTAPLRHAAEHLCALLDPPAPVSRRADHAPPKKRRVPRAR